MQVSVVESVQPFQATTSWITPLADLDCSNYKQLSDWAFPLLWAKRIGLLSKRHHRLINLDDTFQRLSVGVYH